MDCRYAIIIYILILGLVFIVALYYGLNMKSALALAFLISILLLSVIKPLNASRLIKADGYSQLFAIIYLLTSIYLLWYILYMAFNDYRVNCCEQNICL